MIFEDRKITKARLTEFKKDEHTGVYLHPLYDHAFDYSDGREAEDAVYEALKKTTDLGIFSAELIGRIRDWPTEYHFSPVRHNLLRHFEFKDTDKILELGCGCGAITRQLGETGASVIAVEGSLARARSAAARCRDLANVKVYVSNFQDIEFENDFNYVTLIGVFEYCPMYFKGDNPEAECLGIVKSALSAQGKFILAIENRLGLKYFMGLEEDHVGIPFFGLQDLYRRDTAVTFGRAELASLLKQNGFSSIEFQYPFPDYKIPNVIFMEGAFQNPKFRPAEIIRALKSRDYSDKSKPLFSENLVWPVLEKNKLIPDLANSFLLIASVKEPQPGKESEPVLAVYYAIDRALKYNIKTEFVEDEEEDISVTKSRLVEDSDPDSESVLIHTLGKNEPYYSGKSLDAEINKKIYEDDFDGYVSLIKEWIDFVVHNGLKDINSDDVYGSKVLPEFFDCVPINLLITDKDLKYFDKEWKYTRDFTLISLLLRYLIYGKHSQIINRHLEGSALPWEKLLNHLGIKFDKETYKTFLLLHNEICSLVYPADLTDSDSYAESLDHFGTGLNIRSLLKKITRIFAVARKTK